MQPPILRHAPGEIAPWSGTYALVEHFGEATGFAVWCNSGDRLPLVTTSSTGYLWFVLIGEPQFAVKAA